MDRVRAAATTAAASPARHRLEPQSFGVVPKGSDGKHPLRRNPMPQTSVQTDMA